MFVTGDAPVLGCGFCCFIHSLMVAERWDKGKIPDLQSSPYNDGERGDCCAFSLNNSKTQSNLRLSVKNSHLFHEALHGKKSFSILHLSRVIVAPVFMAMYQ